MEIGWREKRGEAFYFIKNQNTLDFMPRNVPVDSISEFHLYVLYDISCPADDRWFFWRQGHTGWRASRRHGKRARSLLA